MTYKTVKSYRTEIEIRRSRFISVVERVTSEEELFSVLGSIRKEFFGSTHVCYAAIFDRSGNAARFSDDGEPGGTAGQPILEAIKAQGLRETLVAVVRYFGGIKLGAGGLVRAYSAAAADGLKCAEKIVCEECDVITVETDFTRAKRFQSSVGRASLRLLSTEYTDRVSFTLAAPKDSDAEPIIADILGEKPRIISRETRFLELPETEKY